MIFAAGLGTRLRPLTDTMPKALVSVGGMPLLGRVVTRLRSAGCDRIVVNVHHFPEQIIDYLSRNDNFGIDIRVSDESDMLLDTGGGLKKAAPLFRSDEPILIHNVDIISNIDIGNIYNFASKHICLGHETNMPQEANDACSAVLIVSPRRTSRYLLFDKEMTLEGWVNTKTGERRGPIAAKDNDDAEHPPTQAFAFSGVHIISPQLLTMMDAMPDRFSIIDFYLKVCATTRIKGIVKDDLRLLDVGKTDTLAEAERFLAEIEAETKG